MENVAVIKGVVAEAVEIDDVVDVVECLAVTPRRGSLPDDLVQASVFSENLVEHCLRIVADVPVEMDVDTCVLGEEISEDKGCLVEPLEVRIEAPAPCISVGFLLDDGGFLHECRTALWYLCRERKVRAGIERRIDID